MMRSEYEDITDAPIGSYLVSNQRGGIFMKTGADLWKDLDPTTPVPEWDAFTLFGWVETIDKVWWIS